MKPSLFNRTVRRYFVVIDSQFPQKDPMAFRNAEINEYFRRIKNFQAYTMYPMSPGPEAWFVHDYGMSREQFAENLQGYARHHPENAGRIHYLDQTKRYRFKLAYTYFLAETYVALPFLEKQRTPFVFVLYPGGSFGLGNEKSDNMLKRIFQSPYFRGVIVTQQITMDYLLRKNLCPEDRIDFIYGGFVQFKKADVLPKKYYKKDKPTFDICFVAAKYSEKGVDKGYDLFVDTAKIVCKVTDNIRFHVVGGFDEHDIDVSDIEPGIKFYGFRSPGYLKKFYRRMDIFLSPNRPFELYKGNFDGFPLGIDASYCGVALLTADELKMNRYYKDHKEIDILPLAPEKIADKVLYHYNNLESFYELARQGQKVTQDLFDMNYQIDERIKVFKQHLNLKTGDWEGTK